MPTNKHSNTSDGYTVGASGANFLTKKSKPLPKSYFDNLKPKPRTAADKADEAARTHPFNPKYTGENKQFVNPKK